MRQGRRDREGLVVWLLSAAAFGALVAAGTRVDIALTEPDPVPVGALLGASLTYATFVAVPAAVSYGLARSRWGALERDDTPERADGWTAAGQKCSGSGRSRFSRRG